MTPTDEYDVIIIGAGVAGLHQLHSALQDGLRVRVIEAAEGVGGTWWWNRYPGCRFDTESYTYGYLFSEELYRDWRWSEHFAGQPETEAYLNFVADRLDLRRHMDLGCRVVHMSFDETSNTWSVRTDDGRTLVTQFVITAVGRLSIPQYPSIPGSEDYRGEIYHTGEWPHDPVKLEGRKVAVIGVGSSGIQVATAIAPEVGVLTVFQSTPNWCVPLHNTPIDDDEWNELLGRREEILAICNDSPSGTVHRATSLAAHDLTPNQRLQFYERLLEQPGFAKLFGNFTELTRDEEINAEFCSLLAANIRSRVKDPETAEKLIPTHGYGVRRPPHDDGYYEIFNQPNVRLVHLPTEPIMTMNSTGIVTEKDQYDVDVIIYATGFDAITGALERLDITAGGLSLKDEWADGPDTWLGLQSPGFPNLFFLNGPQSGGANMPRSIGPQVEFLSRLIRHVRNIGQQRVDVTRESAEAWTDHVLESISGTLAAKAMEGWAYGTNTPGKRVVFRSYGGGLAMYLKKLEASENGYWDGFVFSGSDIADRAAKVEVGS
ncbi:flavin-containing monooxygenase [Pedococcus sp. P5_B7]